MYLKFDLERKDLSPEEIEELYETHDLRIHRLLARNRISLYKNMKILKKLAKSEDFWVRIHIAEHPSTPEEVLLDLAKDENYDVARAITHREHIPLKVMSMLAQHPDSQVRLALLQRDDVPESVLFILLYDEDRVVRKEALRVLEEKKFHLRVED